MAVRGGRLAGDNSVSEITIYYYIRFSTCPEKVRTWSTGARGARGQQKCYESKGERETHCWFKTRHDTLRRKQDKL